MTRVGVLGGTFDPIHLGHLDLAVAARQAMALDRLVLLPSHVPPHRGEPGASAAHRFAMTALAIADLSDVTTSDFELSVPGPSYTADTLDRLEAAGTDTRGLFFVLGADAFADIESWKAYPAILDRCAFVVVSRPGVPAADLPARLPALAASMAPAGARSADARVFLVEAKTSPVSSTEVRQRLADGRSVSGLVPAAVADYIVRHDLYTAGGGWPHRAHGGRS